MESQLIIVQAFLEILKEVVQSGKALKLMVEVAPPVFHQGKVCLRTIQVLWVELHGGEALMP